MKANIIKNLILNFLAVTLGFGSAHMAFARSPAVEPVTGISIDDYKPVEQADAKGFDFTNARPNEVQNETTVPAVPRDTVVNVSENNSSKESGSTTLLLLVLLGLPFAIWMTLMKSLDKKMEESQIQDNTVDLAKVKAMKKKSDDDNMDLPKAS